MSLKKHIPNFLTCCNLLCGCIGIFFAARGIYAYAAYLIWAALLFDFLDGFMARLLKVQSPIGKELDSLADMVTFGVLPSFIMFGLLRESTLPPYIGFCAFLIAICSALRLAKFNIDDRQTTYFIGMPTPANALLISSVYFLYDSPLHMLTIPVILLLITVVFSLLLVAPVKMFSLKLKSFAWKDNVLVYLFVPICIISLIFFKLAGFVIIIFAYILFSLAGQKYISDNDAPGEPL